ncbi:MAG TPA: hypothetical protein VMM59_07710 [Thermohalobaculum sp.]|nr:hypothetical protein [Thermohalobaculum sp.]
MRRGIQALLVIVVMVSLPVFWLFRAPAALPARFAPEDCARLALTDTATGQPVVGVEDIAPLPDGDTMILSALDRLALRRRPQSAREGGLYQVSLARLAAGDGWARPLVPAGSIAGGLRPHGIAVSDDGERLALVNRARDGTTSIIVGALGSGAFSPRHARTDAAFCRANDLDFTGTGPMTLRVTLDRADCGVAWADLRPGASTGRVIRLDLAGGGAPEVETGGLSFANGIAGLWVAETRASRLHHLLDRPVPLPGGPDNLTWDERGGLVTALHPSMLQIAAYLFGYSGSAPTRVVRVAPDRGVEVLVDDPHGDVFAGATVAVLRGGVLVAGSAADAGVMVCRKGGA